MKDLKSIIRTIPDFPKPGIQFRDITTLCLDPEGMKQAIDQLVALLDGVEVDAILGLEARGFMFAAPMAYLMGKPFIPVRKAGKLPGETEAISYDLEYGSASIEVHKDAIKKGMKLVLVDDLLATGGTMEASIKLVEKLGAEVVKALFVIELPDIGGRKVLEGYDVETLVSFEGD